LLGLIFFVGGGQEELGWRGFALPRLLTMYSPVVASIILGLAWSFWHVPLFFSPHAIQNQIPFFWYVLNTIFFSGILTNIHQHNKNVILPMIAHAGLNAIGNYSPASLAQIYPYVTISMFVFWLGLTAVWKRKWNLPGLGHV
jgi:membrane protease YdiL (CAAX protease family)